MISPRLARLSGPLVLIGAAAAATFTNAPGWVVADARYEHLADPAQFLARHASAWDPERSLGAPAQYFSPVLALFQTAAGALGASPWVIQRLTHTLLLAAAALGAHVLARTMHGSRAAGLGAGVVYAFNPFTSQFLLPSGLFAAYSIAPWLALAAWRGVARQEDHWRWAAAFALPVFAMGMLNTSSLLMAMVPAAVLLLGRLSTPSVTVSSAWSWIWRTGLLTLGVSAAVGVVIAGVGDTVRFNLETTETPEAVASSSAAGESWRGLGQWLSYLRFGDAATRLQATSYFTNPAVIVASFALVTVAGLALALRRDRTVATLAGLAAVGVVLMVGIHPVGDPSPFGSVLETGFDQSLFVRGFRSMYKAGTAFQLALALLAGITVDWISRHRRRLIAAGTAGAILVSAFPFWTGHLYPPADRHDDVPAYWEDALAWFDDVPDTDAVLVVPSLARTRYRWGYVNDTLFDAALDQPVVSARTLPQSTPVLAALAETIDQYLSGPAARPGALGPLLRRIGVRWVIVQNDLDWASAGVARPATFDQLRIDPDLRRVAAFGDPGQNTTEGPAFDAVTRGESTLPPVEIYEVVGGTGITPAVHTSALVASGGPDVWPTLARAGWLDRPVLLDGLAAALPVASGDEVVMTDGGQRRAVRVAEARSIESPILTPGQDVGRPVQSLFEAIADQTIATHGDYSTVSASSSGTLFDPWAVRWWSDRAVDRDLATAWATAASGAQWLELRLGQPVEIGRIEADLLAPASSAGSDRLNVEVHLEHVDGSVTTFARGDGPRIEVEPPPGSPAAVAVRLTLMHPGDGLVGIREVTVTDAGGRRLDGRRRLRTAGAEGGARPTSGELAASAAHHLFTRVVRDEPEETLITREFWRAGGLVGMSAVVRVDALTPDAVIDDLLRSSVGISASNRARVEASARTAIDNSVGTAWEPNLANPGALAIRLPVQRVTEVELVLIVTGPGESPRSRLRKFTLQLRGEDGRLVDTRVVELAPVARCDELSDVLGDGVCLERVRVPVDSGLGPVGEVVIDVTDVDVASGLFARAPVQVAEVQLYSGVTPIVTEESVAADGGCRPVFRLDGVAVEMRPFSAEPIDLDDLRRGVLMVSCAFISLDGGWHVLEGLPDTRAAVETVAIDPLGARAVPGPVSAASVTHRSSTRLTLETEVAAGDIIVTGIPAHDAWKVSARGVDGSRTIADGFIAWRATSSGQVLLDLEYGPQRWYRSAWYITAVTVAVALWLLVPGRRHENGLPGRIAASVPRSESPRFTWVSVVGRVGMLGGVGWFVGGWTGLVAGAVAALLTMRVRVLAIVAAIGPLVLSGLTLIEGSLDDEVVGAFATTRHVTHEVGVALAVVWIGAAVGIWSDSGREPTLAPMSYGRRRRWPLAILVAVALALVALGVD